MPSTAPRAPAHTGARSRTPRASVWAVLCLALVLLWAQMGGWVHGLSHTLGSAHPTLHTAHPTDAEHPPHTPHGETTQAHAEQVCETCLAFAALGGTALLPSMGVPAWAALSHAAPWPRTGLQAWHTAFAAYRTRAPPG